MNADSMTDARIAAGIAPNPDRSGAARAWVLPRYVSVCAVIGQWEADYGKVDAIAEAYDLPAAAVEAAIAYYERHRAAIDARIAANRAFFAWRRRVASFDLGIVASSDGHFRRDERWGALRAPLPPSPAQGPR